MRSALPGRLRPDMAVSALPSGKPEGSLSTSEARRSATGWRPQLVKAERASGPSSWAQGPVREERPAFPSLPRGVIYVNVLTFQYGAHRFRASCK